MESLTDAGIHYYLVPAEIKDERIGRMDPGEESMHLRLEPRWRPKSAVKIICHRGGVGFGPENTLESLRAAIEAGVWMVETDVRETADGELVIHHNALANKKFIQDYEVGELRALHPDIPLLREYLELAAGRCRLDLEAKALDIHRLARAIKDFGDPSQVIITSFNSALLAALKEEYPEFEVGWVVRLHRELEMSIEIARKTRMRYVLPRQGLVEENFVAEAHAAGLLVYTWTVNRAGAFRNLVGKGIDGVITDRYPLISKAQEEIQAELEPPTGAAATELTP